MITVNRETFETLLRQRLNRWYPGDQAEITAIYDELMADLKDATVRLDQRQRMPKGAGVNKVKLRERQRRYMRERRGTPPERFKVLDDMAASDAV